jgi:hypothetical protein
MMSLPLSEATNVRFNVVEFLTPEGDAWCESNFGSFDLINQRYLVLGFRSGQWKSVLERYYKLLKPGGWVQMVEPHLVLHREYKLGSEMRRAMDLLWKIAELRNIDCFAYNEYPKMLEQIGFVEIQTQTGGMTGRRKFNKLPENAELSPEEMDPDLSLRWLYNTFRAVTIDAIELGIIKKDRYEEMCRDMLEEMKSGEEWTSFKLMATWAKVSCTLLARALRFLIFMGTDDYSEYLETRN